MRYFKQLGQEWVENGSSKVRGATIETFQHPKIPDRMVKVFSVQEVVRQSEMNPILPGMMLGLSFDKMKINSRDYEWKREEEKMLPLKLQLHQG